MIATNIKTLRGPASGMRIPGTNRHVAVVGDSVEDLKLIFEALYRFEDQEPRWDKGAVVECLALFQGEHFPERVNG